MSQGVRWHHTVWTTEQSRAKLYVWFKGQPACAISSHLVFKLKHQPNAFICLLNRHKKKKRLLNWSHSRTGHSFYCHLVFWPPRLHAAARAECRPAPQWRCTVLFWTWNALWMEVKAEVVETALALLPLTLFILYVTFSGRGEGCCEGLCNRSSRSCSNAQGALWSQLFPPPRRFFFSCWNPFFYQKLMNQNFIFVMLQNDKTASFFFWQISCICNICILAILRQEERGSDKVLTRRDKNEMRTSSLYSSVSLDVTLHPFISSLTCSSRMKADEWFGRAEGCKDQELGLSSTTKYSVLVRWCTLE